jgi:TRAP-type mannitol/chloroaromatic compound transport system substrate-binding protein
MNLCEGEKMKAVKRVCLGLAIMLGVGFSIPGTAPAKTIKWKMASSWPKGTMVQWAADEFARTVNAMSGGRLEIKSYAAGVFVGALEVTDSVRMGTIDVAHCSPGYQMGKLPAAPLFAYIPFGMDAVPYMTWFYDNDGMALYKELYKPYDLGFVAPCGVLPTEDLAWSNKPIKTMDDFKGLKFRTSGYWGEVLSRAGASVMMLPAGEIYEALQRNILDAGEFSIPSMDKDLSFNETAKYLLVPGIHQLSTITDITINKRSWAKLPDDLKEIVKVAAQSVTMRMLTHCINADIKALAFFKEKGVQIEYLNPEIQRELAKETDQLLDEKAAKDPFFSKVLKSQRDFRAGYANYKKLMTPDYQ